MSIPTSVEVTAASVEDAIEKGLAQLGVGPSQVIVEVIEEPSRGLFGLGAKQAKVRLQLLSPPPPPKTAAPPVSEPVIEPPEPVEAPADEPEPAAPPDDTVYEPAVAEADANYDYDDDFDDGEADVDYGDTYDYDDDFDDDEEDGDGDTYDYDDDFDDEIDDSPAKPRYVSASEYDDYDDDFFNEDGTFSDDVIEDKPAKPPQQRPPARANRADKPDNTHKPPVVSSPVPEYRPPHSRERTRERPPHHKQERSTIPSQVSDISTPPVTFPKDDTDAAIAEHLLGEMLDIMRVDADIEVSRPPADAQDDPDYTPPWLLNIVGNDKRMDDLVGKRGDTLAALQYLTRLMVSKKTEARAEIVVDVNDYRNSRSDKLEKLAHRMADQAIETGRVVRMEPMPAHERRIIHMVLRRREDVETESQGQGDARRVTIIPK